MAATLGHLLQAARPKQWTKNIVVFAAIVFSQKLGDTPALAKVTGAFAVFCLLSSGIYLINDVIDAHEDKLHPLKSQRPIAAGKIARNEALRWALWPFYAWADRLYERGIESADALLVQTDSQRMELQEQFGRDSILFKSGHPVPPESVLQKRQPPIVLWIGAVKPAKQPQLFLDLSKHCAPENARFLLVGRVEDTSWRPRLFEAAKMNPRFFYRDEVPFDQVSSVFAEASVLVNTTIPDYEGLPNAFIQAWLHAVPVVSLHADPDGMLEREQIGFHCGSQEKLTERVNYLLADPSARESMGRQARRFAANEFGIKQIVSRFEQIISSRPALPP